MLQSLRHRLPCPCPWVEEAGGCRKGGSLSHKAGCRTAGCLPWARKWTIDLGRSGLQTSRTFSCFRCRWSGPTPWRQDGRGWEKRVCGEQPEFSLISYIRRRSEKGSGARAQLSPIPVMDVSTDVCACPGPASVPGDFLGLAALFLDSLVLTQAFPGAGPMKPQRGPFDLLLAHSLPWNRQFTCRRSVS